MLKKVMIISSSVGAGHVRAATAVEQACRHSGQFESVQHIDMLHYSSRLFRSLYRMSYVGMVQRSPMLYGWLYRQTDRPWKNIRKRVAVEKWHIRKFIRLLRRERPDVCICTHFLPAEILSWQIAKGKLDTRHLVVVTDFDVHAMWLCRRAEHFFVGMEESRALLMDQGVGEEFVCTSGIPIDRSFTEKKDKGQSRTAVGLDADKRTLLVSAGGMGFGPVVRITRELLKLKHSLQIVVICGRNKRLRKRIRRLLTKRPPPAHLRFVVLGFTNQMDTYMSAADLIVGKTGGLTTSEALARHLPFVVFNTIPGQEQRNADYLLENGAALRCNNPETIAYKIDQILAEPGRLEHMQQQAAKLARPQAAQIIVDYLRKFPEPVNNNNAVVRKVKRRWRMISAFSSEPQPVNS